MENSSHLIFMYIMIKAAASAAAKRTKSTWEKKFPL
jgi:hypothetical protein